MKSLVVFYTRTGNARFVAQTIAARVGADIEEVIDLKKRSGIIGYLRGASDARNGRETEIAPITKSPTDYDLIIIGTPIWYGRPTPAIRTYLRKNSLAGKKVAVFFVQGRKTPQGIEQTKALMPDSNYAGELSIQLPLRHKVKTEKQIDLWCDKLTAV